MNTKKIVTIALLVASVFVYIVATRVFELVFDALHQPITRDFVLTIPEILAVVLAALVFFLLYRSQKTQTFLTEVVGELSKVTYPTKKEAGQSAGVVIMLIAVAAVCLSLFDIVWSFFTKFILN